jgi:hypothetical protein
MTTNNKLECYISLGRKDFSWKEHSSLLGPFLNDDENEVFQTRPRGPYSQHFIFNKNSGLMGPFISVANTAPETVFKTLHFLVYLWMGPISLSATLQYAKKAFQWQTLKLVGPILKWWIKWKVANTAPQTVFTTLHFLVNLQMGPISLSATLHYAKKVFQWQTL